jgi:hypothetical protein
MERQVMHREIRARNRALRGPSIARCRAAASGTSGRALNDLERTRVSQLGKRRLRVKRRGRTCSTGSFIRARSTPHATCAHRRHQDAAGRCAKRRPYACYVIRSGITVALGIVQSDATPQNQARLEGKEQRWNSSCNLEQGLQTDGWTWKWRQQCFIHSFGMISVTCGRTRMPTTAQW